MALEKGLIKVNSRHVSSSYIVKNGDKITHDQHRHEPSITSEDLDIIHESDDLLVINKPAGIPVITIN